MACPLAGCREELGAYSRFVRFMELELKADWLSVTLAALAVAAALFFFASRMMAERKRRFRALVMEIPRLLAVAMLAFSLLQPEVVTRISKDVVPEVVALIDDSDSMATKDVLVPGKDGAPAVLARKQWIAERLASGVLKPLRKKYKVSIERFSTPPGKNGKRRSDGTDLAYALDDQLAPYANLRAVLLLSDGDWNMGESPLAAAVKLRAKGVRVHCVRVGSPKWLPDVELSGVAPPSFCLANERVSIPYQVRSRMPKPVDVKIILASLSGPLETKEIRLSPGETVRGSFLWKPPQMEGARPLTIKIPPLPGEVVKDNNSAAFNIDVKKEALKTLVIDSFPRWEYRYLRNALERDPGVDNRSILFLPGMRKGGGKHYLDDFPSKEELSKFDVIFLGDVGIGKGELTKKDAELLEGLVRQQGSGIVFLPGRRGRHLSLMDTPLGDAYPVDLDPSKPEGIASGIESKTELTGKGRKHFLLTLADTPSSNGRLWRGLPGFFWCAAVAGTRPGTEVLATHPGVRVEGGRMPIIAIREYGNGEVLFMGTDNAWRWRKGVEDKYHYRFWGQVARWMAHKRHLAGGRGVRCFVMPEKPVKGHTVTVNATLSDRAGFPVDGATVTVTASPENGKTAPVVFQMTQKERGWGVYYGEFTPESAGKWKLDIKAANGALSATTRLEVAGERLEVVGRPARSAPLGGVAKVTKGKFVATDGLDDVIDAVAAMPKALDVVKRFPLWSRWWWAAIMLALLALNWILRKTYGLI